MRQRVLIRDQCAFANRGEPAAGAPIATISPDNILSSANSRFQTAWRRDGDLYQLHRRII